MLNLCFKKQYETESQVILAIAEQMEYGAPLLSYYYCPSCHAYHMTSKKKKLDKK